MYYVTNFYQEAKKLRNISIAGFDEEIYIHLGALRSQIIACSVGISYPDKNYEIKRKNSSHYSIEYVYEGSGVIHHGNELYEVNAGDFFILHPNTYHHYYTSPKNPWKKIFLTINGDPHFFDNLLQLYKIDKIIYFPRTHSAFELEDIFNLIKDNSNNNIDHQIEILLMKLVISLSDCHRLNKHGSDNKINAAKHFIERRVTTKLTVEELSKYVNLDRSYLTRQFKKNFGLSPSEYILIAKIEYAANLLKASNMSIEIISQKLSFTDKSYFSRQFKAYTGFTPGEFRKQFSQKNKQKK